MNYKKQPRPKQPCPKQPRPKQPACDQQTNCQKKPTSSFKVNDKVIVCTTQGQETRTLQPISSLCDSAFVQVTNGRVGYNVKDRFYVWTEINQTLTTGLVAYNTGTARKVLNCGNNWSDVTNTYTVPETGLYQIIATVSIIPTTVPFNYTFAIQSTLNGDLSIVLEGNCTHLPSASAQGLLQFSAGDQISVRIQAFPGPVTLRTRMLQIVQL